MCGLSLFQVKEAGVQYVPEKRLHEVHEFHDHFLEPLLTQRNLGYIVDTSLVVLHVLDIQSWLSFLNILKFLALEVLHVVTCTTNKFLKLCLHVQCTCSCG